MSENRILELLARKMANEATDAELSELRDLLKVYRDGLYYEEAFDQLWIGKPQPDTDDAYLLHQLKHPELADNNIKADNWTLKRKVFAFASLLIFAIAVGLIFYKIRNSETVAADKTEIFTGNGIRKKVTLPDGTNVWLNSNSRLSFNRNLNSGKTRTVELTGEAYFDVTKNKDRPFVIHTPKFAIKVLGTAFNVRAYKGDRVTEAALIRGEIELTVAGSNGQKIILKPNEKFILLEKPSGAAGASKTRSLSIESIKPVEVQSRKYIEETSWLDNKLVFQNQTFDQMVPRLERWFNVTIKVNDASINDQHFTGIFENENLEQALRAMQLIKPFKYKIEKDEVTIN